MKDKAIICRIDSYASLQALLNDLYFTYLQGIYEPLTYGKDWVLASGDNKYVDWPERIVVPSTWLSPSHINLPLASYDTTWATGSLETYGLVAGSRWKIMGGLQRIIEGTGFIGLATNNSDLAKDALLLAKNNQGTGPHVLGFLLKNVFHRLCHESLYDRPLNSNRIALVPYVDTLIHVYQYLFVFSSCWWKQCDRTVLLYDGSWGNWEEVRLILSDE